MDKSFEKQITEKLNRMEIKPSEGLLDAIFEKRAAKPKRFAGIPYSGLVLAALIISAGAITFMLFNDSNSKTRAVDKTIASESPRTLPESGNENSRQKAGSVQPDAGIEKPLVADKTLSNRKSGIRPAKSAIAVIGKSKTAVSAPESDKQSKVKSSDALQPASYFDVNSASRPEIVSEMHKGNSHLYVYETAADKDFANAGFVFSRLSRISKIPIGFEDEKLKTMASSNSVFDREAIKRRPFFVDMLYTPSLNMPGTNGNSDLNKASNAITRNTYNTQFGIRVSVPVSNQVSVFSGLFMRDQSNHYKGDLNYSVNQTRIDKTVTFINDPSGNVIKVVKEDTVNYVEEKTQNVNFKNTYSMIQVPLGLSYNFGHGKFDFAFHGSALLNIFRNSNGHTLNLAEHNTRSYSSNGTFMGLGAGFSFMTAYKISPKFRLIFEPGMQYFGINAIKAGSMLNERSFSPQCSIGLRYTVF